MSIKIGRLQEDNSFRDQIRYLNRQQIVAFRLAYCRYQIGIRIAALHGVRLDVHGINSGKYGIKVCTLRTAGKLYYVSARYPDHDKSGRL